MLAAATLNTFLYIFGYVALAATLGGIALGSPAGLRLPAFPRIVLGVAVTPLVTGVLVLGLGLIWPSAYPLGPILVPLAAAVAAAIAGQRACFRAWRWIRALVTRFRLLSLRWEVLLPLLVLTCFIGLRLGGDALRPVASHDALAYFQEARIIANNPSWETHRELTNPSKIGQSPRGHTHTPLYPIFLTPALLAEDAKKPGWPHDQIARWVVQVNFALLLLALGGLFWAASGCEGGLALAAFAWLLCIPRVSFISWSFPIEAFRFLPLVLAAIVLFPRRPSDKAWFIGGMLLGLSFATHTLNLLTAPLLLTARILAAYPNGRAVRLLIAGGALTGIFTLAYYLYVLAETGRVLGHGMHYYFFADTPLASAQRAINIVRPPTWWELAQVWVERYGVWTIGGALVGGVLVSISRGMRVGPRMLGIYTLLSMAAAGAGIIWRPLQTFTRMMIENGRYSLAIWIFVPAVVLAIAAAKVSWLPGTRSGIGRWITSLVGASCMVLAFGKLRSEWPIPFDAEVYLAAGEWRLAQMAEGLAPGENWLCDRNTAAYFTTKPPVFLYSPGGHSWLRASTVEEVVRLLKHHRVRFVALTDRQEDWWPRTAFGQALASSEVAELQRLERWDVYYIKPIDIPSAGSYDSLKKP